MSRMVPRHGVRTLETEAHYLSPDHPKIGPLIVKDAFPYSLIASDWIHIAIDGWKASYQARSSITFLDMDHTLRHMIDRPDEWEGDVFPVIVLIRGGETC
jgi:hypothetical protein